MSSNAPTFDPLNPTPEDRAEMAAGYLAAGDAGPKPSITSAAFDHGWRMRSNDRAGVVDDDQREIARKIAAGWPKRIREANQIASTEAAIAWFRARQAEGAQ